MNAQNGNGRAQARAVDEYARDVMTINAGLCGLRRLLGSSVPTDFEWWFRFAPDEVAAGWVWPQNLHQDEIRAATVAELLEKWARVSWRDERARAKTLETKGGVL